MTLELRPANRSLIDLLERVLEKGLLVTTWLLPRNKAKARPSRRSTTSRAPKKARLGD